MPPVSAYVVDLFVAIAAGAGDPAAVRWVHERIAALAPAAIRDLVFGDDLDEVIQRVSIRLLVPGDRPVSLGSYAGRGPIEAWLRAVILRAALSLRRRRAVEAAVGIDDLPWLGLTFITEAPEIAATWRRHAPAFRAAFETAIAALPTRARIMLRMHFLDGLSADDLGRIYNVHRITAYRWIAEAKLRVLDRVRIELGTRIAASPSEIDSLIRTVRSQFSITVERLLAPDDPPATPSRPAHADPSV